MTTYAEFQTAYTEKVWRTGDTLFAAAFDNLVRKAESRIKRDMRNHSLLVSVDTTLTDNELALPTNFRNMRTVFVDRPASYGQHPGAVSVTADQYERYQTRYNLGEIDHHGRYYNLLGTGLLRVVGRFTAEDPGTIKYTYNSVLEPYADDPTDPYYDENPDFFEAALGMYAYDWLEDTENEAKSVASYNEHLTSMKMHDSEQEWGTGPLDYRLPGEVL